MSVRGISLAYRATGAGRPLLLINGSGATDPRGMGASTDRKGDQLTVQEMADDAAALLQALRIHHADVLGWSLGGWVAQELAIRHPAEVAPRSESVSATSETAWPRSSQCGARRAPVDFLASGVAGSSRRILILIERRLWTRTASTPDLVTVWMSGPATLTKPAA